MHSNVFLKIKLKGNVPSVSACCNTIPRYSFPTRSGFGRNEFRLNQCPFPVSASWLGSGETFPKRRRVYQC